MPITYYQDSIYKKTIHYIDKLEKYFYGKQTVNPELGPGGNPNAGSTPGEFLRSSNNALAFILSPILA